MQIHTGGVVCVQECDMAFRAIGSGIRMNHSREGSYTSLSLLTHWMARWSS
mgnify:CR=1 FL=1